MNKFEEQEELKIQTRELIMEEFMKGQQYSGVIQCPACNKSVRYMVSQVNKHIQAKCETLGCQSWKD